jgi:hypothetical protein
MKWKIVRNGEPDFYDTHITGTCKRTGETAEVTSCFSGKKECKTDLQKTYRFLGYKCSLQTKDGYQDPACLDVCPLIRKEHL